MWCSMVVMVMVTSPSCPKQHWADVALQDIKWRTVGVRGRQEHLKGAQETQGRGWTKEQ